MLHDFVIRTKKNYDLRWITTAVQTHKECDYIFDPATNACNVKSRQKFG